MISRFYAPLLKSKAGEFTALSNLTPTHKDNIVPVFDVTKVEFDHIEGKTPKTPKTHLQGFCKKVIKAWPDHPMFVDTDMINDWDVEGQTPIEFIYSLLATKDITPMPVVRISSPDQYKDMIGTLLLLYPIDNIGLRVTIKDVTTPAFETRIDDLLVAVGISADKCHLILDLADADFTQLEDFSDAIVDVVKDFPYLNEWNSFTIAGGAFPSMGNIKTSPLLVPRNDWKFYNTLITKVAKDGITRDFNYGDYSIVAPGYFEFDPKKMSTSANIRYTYNDFWYVVKGTKLKEKKDWQQFYGQADNIVGSGYYLGENFSAGDLHIKKCSERKTSTGNPNVWIAVGTNHHFTKVLTDLFARRP